MCEKEKMRAWVLLRAQNNISGRIHERLVRAATSGGVAGSQCQGPGEGGASLSYLLNMLSCQEKATLSTKPSLIVKAVSDFLMVFLAVPGCGVPVTLAQ